MAELIPSNSGRQQKTVRRFLKVDMTPMVDLAFLLITFFIYTTSISEPVATRLYMPAPGPDAPVKASNSLTFLLAANDSVFWYEGTWEEAHMVNKIFVTGYDVKEGVGNVIRQKQKKLGNASSVVVLIKPLEESRYKNLVDALDEMKINAVSKYAIVAGTSAEEDYAGSR